MPVNIAIETTLELSWVPAPLIDSGAQMAAAKIAMEHSAASPGQRAEAILRLAELLRRIDPQGALELIAGLLPAGHSPHEPGYSVEAARIAAHARLNLGEYEVARAWAKLVGEVTGESPAARLLHAKIVQLQDRVGAIALLNAIIGDEALFDQAPETAAEALFLRGRWLGEEGSFEEAVRDFKALQALADKLGAPLTGAFAQVGRQLCETLGAKSVQGSISQLVVERLKSILAADLALDRPLGPVPPWIHGLMTHTAAAGKPEAFPKVALLLALFMENAESFEDAYLTYLYGAKLTERLPEVEDTRLAVHLKRFLERVGTAEAESLKLNEEKRLREWRQQ